jgi:aldose 1-epimerase
MTSQTIDISDETTGSRARILVSLGFNCFSWRPSLEDGPREMLWAETDFAGGGKRPSGSGIPLLFPFPGRIGGAAFAFNGRQYELAPGDPFGNAIHGFVYNRPWRAVEQSESRVAGEFQASVDDTSILKCWPSDFRIRVSYEVRGRELVSTVRYENVGDGPLPCGFGTHAYFRLPLAEGSLAAETIVTAPVEAVWEAQNMLPTGRRLPVAKNQRLESGLRLGEQTFDTYFTGLTAEADGKIRTRLADPASGRVVTQTFDRSFTQCIVYTPAHREAICLEPYTSLPDFIRLGADGHDTGMQVLEPGAAFETTIGIAVASQCRDSAT